MPIYITQETMSAISMPIHNAAIRLQHFYAPVIHLIIGKSITDYYKLAKDTATMGIVDYRIWKGIGEPGARIHQKIS